MDSLTHSKATDMNHPQDTKGSNEKLIIHLSRWKAGQKMLCKNCSKGKFEADGENKCPKCGQEHVVKVVF